MQVGARAGSTTPDRFVGVSNAGGLTPFKGKPASDTSHYRELVGAENLCDLAGR